MAEQVIVDGSVNWAGGVDSVKATSLATEANPQGMLRSQLCWLDNATVRNGGINQRTGWQWKGRIHDGTAAYQGGFMYEPLSGIPYPVVCIGGHVYRLDPDFVSAPVDISVATGLFHPADQEHFYFAQPEGWLVIQAGDMVTLPLFYNDANAPVMRRSVGITNPTLAVPAPGVNEIPAAGPMDYYLGRLWYAQNRTYSAGDMVGNHNSGTLANDWRDSVLNITENPLCFGGDGFTVPIQAGSIRALFHNANLNTQLGQGQLLIGTRKAVYTLSVPQTRTEWINSTANNQPTQTVAQLVNGPVNDRSVVQVNGDVYYQTLDPGISSLYAAVRNFQGWGNRAISANEDRVLAFNDRALLRASSGIYYQNRLLQTALPVRTPQGIVHQAIIPLDFVPISSFAAESFPVWEGIYEGLPILQLLEGDFGGLQRAFAVVVSARDGGIDLWELTNYQRSDFQDPSIGGKDGESRVTWIIEFPAFNWGQEFKLKEMVGGELWVDKLYGEVIFRLEWRSDGDPCWRNWYEWKECQPRDSGELPESVTYPLTQYREGFRATMTFPKPPIACGSNTGRPAHIGYQMQARLTIKGWCRVRGFLLFALPFERKLYQGMICGTTKSLGL